MQVPITKLTLNLCHSISIEIPPRSQRLLQQLRAWGDAGDWAEGAVARLPRQGGGPHRSRPCQQLHGPGQEAGAGQPALHVRHHGARIFAQG